MTDMDELIRDALAKEAGRAHFDRGRWEPSATRLAGANRRRLPVRGPVRRTLVAVAVAVVLAAAIAVPLALLSRLGSGTRPGRDVAPTPAATGYVRHADLDDGLSIRVPAAWTFHQDPSGPAEPRTVFAVGSWPFPTGGECAPMAAQEQLPAEGTLFWVMEYRDPQGAEFPDRPAIFDLDPATLASYECSVAPSYLIRFQDAGRFFQAHVAFGPDASDSLGPEVLRALESLDVIAPVPEGCPAGTGPWSDPACPQPTWVRAVIDRAGYEVIDDTGSAFEARAPDLGSEFYIHTTDEPEGAIFRGTLRQEGYRLALTIDGIDVYSDGERQVWTVQGLHVWISGAPVDTPGPVIEKLVRASTAIYYEAIDTRP